MVPYQFHGGVHRHRAKENNEELQGGIGIPTSIIQETASNDGGHESARVHCNLSLQSITPWLFLRLFFFGCHKQQKTPGGSVENVQLLPSGLAGSWQ